MPPFSAVPPVASRRSSRTCTSTRSTPARAAATSPCRTSPGGPGARASACSAPATSPIPPGTTTCARRCARPSRACTGSRPEAERDIARRLPPRLAGAAEADPVRFMLSVEISTIYKRDDRTRKVHHLIYLPDLDAVARFNTALGRIGNLGSDGRPILGLDSRDLLEITLEASPDGYLVPAHIWTPWFSALGSKSGFDAIADCYADLAEHIFAVETGLSSDPAMNWRVGSLDRYQLVSNSDAHSPPALGREATVLTAERRLLRRPGGAAHRRRPGRHDRVLPGGGQVPRGRAPAVWGQLVAGAHPGGRRALPRVRQAAHRGRAQPDRGAGRPAGRAPAGARPGRHPPGAAGRDPRRDQQGGRPVEEGRGAAQRAARRARPGAGDPDHDAARARSRRPAASCSPRASAGCAAATSAGCPATTASTA